MRGSSRHETGPGSHRRHPGWNDPGGCAAAAPSRRVLAVTPRLAAAFALALIGAPAAAQNVVPASTSIISFEPCVHPAPDYRALAQQIAALQEQLARLSAAKEPPAPPAVRTVANREGFSVQSADKSFQLRLRGYVHSDGRFINSTASQAGSDSFLLRRVRPIVEVTSFGRFELRLMPDFGEGRVVLQDAYADVRLGRTFRIRTGKFKSPFGLERLASATELQFPERGTPTLLAPNRDIGVMASGAVGSIASYQIALMNGVPDGSSADVDENGGKDVVGRVFAYAFRTRGPALLRGLGFGVAASAGTETGSRTTPGLPAFRTIGAQTFFRYRSDGTVDGTAMAAGSRRRRSAQALWHFKRAAVIAELTGTTEKVRRGAITDRVVSRAWLAGASIVLTGEAATPRGVTPRRDFDPRHGGWGAFEVTTRLTGLSLDGRLFPRFADPATAARVAREWGLGLNWYLIGGIKFTTSFHRTTFTGGAVAGSDRPAERALLSRLQFAF